MKGTASPHVIPTICVSWELQCTEPHVLPVAHHFIFSFHFICNKAPKRNLYFSRSLKVPWVIHWLHHVKIWERAWTVPKEIISNKSSRWYRHTVNLGLIEKVSLWNLSVIFREYSTDTDNFYFTAQTGTDINTMFFSRVFLNSIYLFILNNNIINNNDRNFISLAQFI